MSDDILDFSFYSDTLDEHLTLREYLKRLLITLWDEEEGFSGKRPFGNSSWQAELAIPFVEAGIIQGQLEGEHRNGKFTIWGIGDYDTDTFDKAIKDAITRL